MKISDSINEHLGMLCETIGARPVGSSNNRMATDYAAGVMRANGFEVEEQRFECMDWRRGAVSLKLDGRVVPAAISDYSLPCSVNTGFLAAGSLDELKRLDLRGRVLVMEGDLTRETIMPKNFRFWNPEHHQELIRTLEEKAPAAIVTVSFANDTPVPVIEDGDFDIPVAIVAGCHADLFRQSAGKEISLQMVSERWPVGGFNVIARKNPKAANKKIILAHIDTKPDTPGALDNAAGVSALLRLSEILKNCPDWMGIELIAINGEDYYSNPGQNAYLDQYGKHLTGKELVINCDGAGMKDSKTGISPMGCDEELTGLIAEIAGRYPDLELAEPWYEGDHGIFAPFGNPVIAITSKNIFGMIDSIIHTEKDVKQLVDPKILEQTAQLIREIVIHKKH